MREKIKQIMAAVFSIIENDIPNSASTSTIENWDSLNHMNLIVAIEEEFKVQFTDDEIIKIVSFEEIEKSLKEKLNL